MNGVPGKCERLISLRDAADRLSVSVRTLYRLIADGLIAKPVEVSARSRALCESDLDDYIERLKRGRRP